MGVGKAMMVRGKHPPAAPDNPHCRMKSGFLGVVPATAGKHSHMARRIAPYPLMFYDSRTAGCLP